MSYPQYYNARIETLSREQARDMQERKLRRQVRYTYDRSALYRQKFDTLGLHPEDIRTLEDLRSVPFTTTEELRDSQIAAPPLGRHAAAPMSDVIRIHSSSGTTGRPRYIGITRHDRQTWTEALARVYWASGVRPTSIVALGIGFSFFVGGLPLHDAIEEVGATFIPVGAGASHKLISSIQNFGVNQLTCTPSYATYLAEYVRSKFNVDPRSLGIERMLVGGEPGGGMPAIRRRIEEEWGAIVMEGLGNADIIPIFAAECEARNGMHYLTPDLAILEIIDPQTGDVLPLDEGEVEGELVLTHIDRECVPLIRYRTRDRVIAYTDPCPCGRTGIRLRCIGRSEDMLVLRDREVWPSAVKDAIVSMRPRTTGEVQILLDHPGPSIEPPLRLEVEYGHDVEDLSGLKQELERMLHDTFRVAADAHLVPPGTLPRYEMKAQLLKKQYEVATNVPL